VVRPAEERCTSGVTSQVVGSDAFDRFIVDNFLFDFPLVGRSFTWYI